jgi:putative SOS response-associated peptidase YedK
MCGRYSITSPAEAIQRVFQVPELPNLPARYNVAPTQDVPVVRVVGDNRDGDAEEPEADGGRHLVQLRWGLVPFWAEDPSIGAKMINARAESAADKPAFRAAFRRRRCLVVADGFYEWQAPPKGGSGEKGQRKQPYRIQLTSGEPFGFAGLWERWRDPADQSVLETCTILTTDANDALREIHPRMPVMLSPETFGTWLDPETDVETAKRLLAPDPDEQLTAYPISTRVNAVRNDDPTILEPIDGAHEGASGASGGGSDGGQGGAGQGGAGQGGTGGDRQQSLF